MSMNILTAWILYCVLFTITEQKKSITNFRSLPLMSDKLTIAELPSYNLFEPYGPGTYAFGYEIEDTASKNIQFRDEEKLQNGTVRGSYGLVRPNGLVSITRYIADDTGYHSSVQTFNQNDKKPTLLTSTESPFLQMSSPSDVMFLDVPNPATISPAVAQQILEQHKIDLITPSSNIPITEIFSTSDDDSDPSEAFTIDRIDKSPDFQHLIPSSHIPQIPLTTIVTKKPTQNSHINDKRVTSLLQNNLKPTSDEISKPANTFQMTNIFESLLPHIPKLPINQSTTKSPQQSNSIETENNMSDETNNEKLSTTTQSVTSNKPSNSFPEFPNIFENILPHIPQLPLPGSSMVTTTNQPSTSASNSLSDLTENESSSTTSTTMKTPSDFPQFPNIFENLLPNLPTFTLPSVNIMSTTQATPSTSSASDLADDNESETSSVATEQSTTSKPPFGINGFPQLPPIFSFLNPENFPIFKPPTNLIPNRQENVDTSTTESVSSVQAMDTIFNQATPTDAEPMFAIIHKNATIVPIYDDDGKPTGIQLINSFIPSNFHIIPFIIPSNYFQSSTSSSSSSSNELPQQNIAHDEVQFEDSLPHFVNDKFHDPLDEINSETWKSRLSRKRKGVKKVRRNNNQRKRSNNNNCKN